MIPVNEPEVGAAELENVIECVKSGWISSAGSYIEEFESGWATLCGRKHGIAVANGTVALQLAVAAAKLQPGSEVILPSFTIMSCLLAVLYNGCVPVLVDCDPETWCMDVSQVEARITGSTSAIMAVHIYGHPVDMDPLLELCERHELVLIEDAAEAHGALYARGRSSGEARWRPCGSFGRVSTFSFYANKLITTGEGGMLLTDDDELAHSGRSLRNLCFGTEDRFRHEGLGFNFRMTNVQAALGVAQMGRFEDIVAKKRWIAERYAESLAGVPMLQLPVEREWARSVYWMYGVVLTEQSDIDASELARRLKERGIDTRPFFIGMHEQPVLRDKGLFNRENYPVTEQISRRGLYLPSGLALTAEQIETVAAAVIASVS